MPQNSYIVAFCLGVHYWDQEYITAYTALFPTNQNADILYDCDYLRRFSDNITWERLMKTLLEKSGDNFTGAKWW